MVLITSYKQKNGLKLRQPVHITGPFVGPKKIRAHRAATKKPSGLPVASYVHEGCPTPGTAAKSHGNFWLVVDHG